MIEGDFWLYNKDMKPITITLKYNDIEIKVDNIHWDSDVNDLKDIFNRMLVCAGYDPRILDDEAGHYEYVPNEK